MRSGREVQYHYNGHGDVIRLTDMTGATAAEYQYDAWGNITSQTGALAAAYALNNPLLFIDGSGFREVAVAMGRETQADQHIAVAHQRAVIRESHAAPPARPARPAPPRVQYTHEETVMRENPVKRAFLYGLAALGLFLIASLIAQWLPHVLLVAWVFVLAGMALMIMGLWLFARWMWGLLTGTGK
jgi:YD repeat-containing protein